MIGTLVIRLMDIYIIQVVEMSYMLMRIKLLGR